ncbi:MAG: AraC family ligand binding domain-containing protein, partial [Planctomycetota bacterium]
MLIRDDGRWLDALSRGDTVVVTYTHFVHRASPEFGFTGRVIDQHVLNLVVGGGYVAEVGGEWVVLRPGSLIWVGDGVPHSFAYCPGESHL